MPLNRMKTDTFSVRWPKPGALTLRQLARRLKTTPAKLLAKALSERLPHYEAEASGEGRETAEGS